MNIKNIFYFLLVIGLASCGNDYDLEENFDLTELPGYVAFDAPGNEATLADTDVDENAGSVTLTVETPTGTTSDLTVNYTLSGNAVEGVDYTIDGVSGNSGSVVISPDAADFNNRDNADIVVNILTDDVFDETKTLTITLESASNAAGNVAVGRGGTELLTTTSINIANVDCGFDDISGPFDYVTSGYIIPNTDCDGTTADVTGSSSLMMVTQSSFTFADWGFGTYEQCYGGPAANWGTLAIDYCSGVISNSGLDNYDDPWVTTIADVAGPVLTINWSNAYGESGTTVLTRTDGNDWPALSN